MLFIMIQYGQIEKNTICINKTTNFVEITNLFLQHNYKFYKFFCRNILIVSTNFK